ncbi:hypothetical protein CPB83DRAFT_885225 [Crepidotus variabilis]|uniref:Secreted protein n=1 Tax=Crepidotus variabilis TaxID=179855 RepID=A0A9P6EBC9_9AGAR|nr:hypothetical protein CPB83DRAFT_885225 [Crepidotus variabilis]
MCCGCSWDWLWSIQFFSLWTSAIEADAQCNHADICQLASISANSHGIGNIQTKHEDAVITGYLPTNYCTWDECQTPRHLSGSPQKIATVYMTKSVMFNHFLDFGVALRVCLAYNARLANFGSKEPADISTAD